MWGAGEEEDEDEVILNGTVIMNAAAMDVKGKLFGIRFEPHNMFGFYIEDDEHYHLKFRANLNWLEDLITVSQAALVESFDPVAATQIDRTTPL